MNKTTENRIKKEINSTLIEVVGKTDFDYMGMKEDFHFWGLDIDLSSLSIEFHPKTNLIIIQYEPSTNSSNRPKNYRGIYSTQDFFKQLLENIKAYYINL